jgi:hypothetical protein
MHRVPFVQKIIAVMMTMFWLATCVTLLAMLSVFAYCLMHSQFFIALVLSFCVFTQILVVSAAWSETQTVWQEVRDEED